jgi:ketosteroid isomerase-like protein
MDTDISTTNSDKEDVRKAIMYNYDFFHENDLSDYQTFDSFKALYSDSFVLGPSEGKPLLDKETILEEWRALFKENRGEFKLTINRIEVSGTLAYALYHYDEKLTNIKSGDVYFEVTQSAIAILRKDILGKWKFEALRWN